MHQQRPTGAMIGGSGIGHGRPQHELGGDSLISFLRGRLPKRQPLTHQQPAGGGTMGADGPDDPFRETGSLQDEGMIVDEQMGHVPGPPPVGGMELELGDRMPHRGMQPQPAGGMELELGDRMPHSLPGAMQSGGQDPIQALLAMLARAGRGHPHAQRQPMRPGGMQPRRGLLRS